MRIPLGETDIGFFWVNKYSKSATFVSDDGSWSAEYATTKNFRKGTYAEFKQLYPFRNHNPHSRSKVKTKYNAVYNRSKI